MLSNQQQKPTVPVVARRIMKHQRQRSTPVAPMLSMESTAAGYFPENTYTQGTRRQQRRQAPMHRRGLSLDPSMRLQDLRLTNTRSPLGNNNGMVSTNQGPVYQQHIMREAQMHGLTRPGPLEQRGLGNIMEDPSMMNHNTQANFESLSANDDAFSSYFDSQSRPYTPTSLSINGTLTPYDQGYTQSSPIRHGSIDLGLQQITGQTMMTRGGSYQGHIAMKRSQSQNSAPASTSTHGFRNSAVYAPTPMMPLDFTNMVNLDFGYQTGYESSSYSPTQSSPAASSMRASPDLPPMALFGEVIHDHPHLPASENGSTPSSPTKSRSSSPRKKVAPLPDEMAIEDTGITTEQVDAFIQGPDPETSKFICLFEGCNMKPFGRKENIRAHVQTHLGDRKYVCTVCENRFVRPNDLKRHAIIHQGVKEFVCKCGANFGRQDALRRHRIRKPFCVDGDPTLELMRREEKKRGRPRKIAPTETNERRERKETIRKQVMESKRKGSLPRSVASSNKGGRSCSPEENQYGSVSGYSPASMALTPPMSPVDVKIELPCPTLESSVARLSLSPPPSRDSSMAAKIAQELEFGGEESPFGIDHFTPPQSTSSPYGTPPELDLSSSPAASKFTMDFSDTEFPPSNATSIDDFGSLTATTNFSDEFLSDSVLMDQMLKDCNNNDQQNGFKTEGVEDFERYLMLDQI